MSTRIPPRLKQAFPGIFDDGLSFSIPLPPPRSHILLSPADPDRDASGLVKIYSYPSVTSQLGNPRYGYDEAQAREWIAERRAEVQDFLDDIDSGRPPGPLPLILRFIGPSGKSVLAGAAGLFRSDFREVEAGPERDRLLAVNAAKSKGDPSIQWMLGYFMDPDFHGQGIMSACVQFLFAHLWLPVCNIHRVTGTIIVGNVSSRRVLEKAGFRYKGRGANFPQPQRDGSILEREIEVLEWTAPTASQQKEALPADIYAADGLFRTPCRETPLGKLLESTGGAFHESLFFDRGAYGIGVRAQASIPKGTCLVSCSPSLVISPKSSILALSSLAARAGHPSAFDSLNDHEAICTYLALHRSPPPYNGPPLDAHLTHYAYVALMPDPDDLRTPLWWTPEEASLLRCTNMSLAVWTRSKQWQTEWKKVEEIVTEMELPPLSWQLSSRAFPSSLLGAVPFSQLAESTIHRPETATVDVDDQGLVESTPILIPGVDAFNHRRARPMLWEGSLDGVRIVTEADCNEGEEVFNNYGAKSTEEYIFGYGFAIDGIDNADDHVVVKLGPRFRRLDAPPPPEILSDPKLHVHHIRRDGTLPPFLLAQVRAVSAEEHEIADLTDVNDLCGEAPLGWDVEEAGLRSLKSTLERQLQSMRTSEYIDTFARSDVRKMVEIYRRGQRVILELALKEATRLHEEAEERAEELYGDEAGSDEEPDE